MRPKRAPLTSAALCHAAAPRQSQPRVVKFRTSFRSSRHGTHLVTPTMGLHRTIKRAIAEEPTPTYQRPSLRALIGAIRLQFQLSNNRCRFLPCRRTASSPSPPLKLAIVLKMLSHCQWTRPATATPPRPTQSYHSTPATSRLLPSIPNAMTIASFGKAFKTFRPRTTSSNSGSSLSLESRAPTQATKTGSVSNNTF